MLKYLASSIESSILAMKHGNYGSCSLFNLLETSFFAMIFIRSSKYALLFSTKYIENGPYQVEHDQNEIGSDK
jgi:hypothetical protein